MVKYLKIQKMYLKVINNLQYRRIIFENSLKFSLIIRTKKRNSPKENKENRKHDTWRIASPFFWDTMDFI